MPQPLQDPIASATNGNWSRIVAFLMQQQGLTEVVITEQEVQHSSRNTLWITTKEDQRGLVLTLVTDAGVKEQGLTELELTA